MADDTSFAVILAQLRQRDNAAAARVFDRFAARLLGLARCQFDRRLLQKMDPDDVVQSVFHSVFEHLAHGRFELGNWDNLWGLLTCVTIRKCGKWKDYFAAQARDISRETAATSADSTISGLDFLDREPTPAEAAALTDTVAMLVRGLKDHENAIVVRRLQGETVVEICREIGCSQSKVFRVLRHVRQRLERLYEDQSDDTAATQRHD